MENEMIERLATEFMRKNLEGCEAEFIRACEPSLCRCRFFARAAVEAMRTKPSREMILAERERCAKVAEQAAYYREDCAAAIRATPVSEREEG